MIRHLYLYVVVIVLSLVAAMMALALLIVPTVFPRQVLPRVGLESLATKYVHEGWTPVGNSQLKREERDETKTFKNITGETVKVESKGWTFSGGDNSAYIQVAEFPKVTTSIRELPSRIESSSCQSLKQGASNKAKIYVGNIEKSYETTCSVSIFSGAPTVVSSMSWIKGNVLVFVESNGKQKVSIDQLVRAQEIAVNEGMPKLGTPVRPDSLILGALLSLLVSVSLLVWTGNLILRLRRSPEASRV